MKKKKIIKEIFGNNYPGIGYVKVEKSHNKRKEDKRMAELLLEKYGGEYIVLSDITAHKIKSPDILLLNSSLFEYKISTSETSIDTHTRKAIKQLDVKDLMKIRNDISDNLNRVLIIKSSIEKNRVFELVLHRIRRCIMAGDKNTIKYIGVCSKENKIIFKKVTVNAAKGASRA